MIPGWMAGHMATETDLGKRGVEVPHSVVQPSATPHRVSLAVQGRAGPLLAGKRLWGGSFTFLKGNFALAGKFPRYTFIGLNYDHFYSLNLSDDLDWGLGL